MNEQAQMYWLVGKSAV